MNASQNTATSLLKDLGTTDLMARDLDEMFGQVKGKFSDKSLFVRVQLKPEWGTSEVTTVGSRWDSERYPYHSVQFLLPSPAEQPNQYTQMVMGASEYTHYLLVGNDGRRAILCPTTVIDAAPKGWVADGDKQRQVANVPNWTKKLVFFVLTNGKWIKDAKNIWEEPRVVPMDADAFLATL